MKDTLYLDNLLVNKQALLEADWDELLSLQKKYPFSLLINQVLAKKHYLETGFLQSAYYQKTLEIQNNPGLSYSTMMHWKKKELKPSISQEKTSAAPPLSTMEKQRPIEEMESTRAGKDTFAGISTPFAKWLADKDNILEKREDSKIGRRKDNAIELKDEIISESLARIYEKQGLIGEAIEMYRKLSLKNPEKSTYFAKIIENLKNR